MASRYHWAVTGTSTAGAFQAMFYNASVALPAGAIVKRFQLRNWYVNTYNEATSRSTIYGMQMVQTVSFTAGANNGRVIYQSHKNVPFVCTTFEAVVAPVYDITYAAGDAELFVNQRCSYGKSTDGTATIQSQIGPHMFPSGYPNNWPGEISYNFAVLYYL